MNTIKRLKIIANYLKSYKKELIILSVLGLVSAIANGFVPYLTGRLFDAILNPSKIFLFGNEISVWLVFIVLWLIIKLTADIVDWKSSIKTFGLSTIISNGYLSNAFSKTLEFPISFLKDKKMGEIGDKFSKAANRLELIVERIIVQTPFQFLSIVVGLIITFFINIFLSCVLISGMLIYVLILIKVSPKLVELQMKLHNADNNAFGLAYDAISNVQPIKQAVAENYEKKRFFGKFRLLAVKFWTQYLEVWQKIIFSQQIIITFIQAAIFGFSIYFILKGKMTVGELIMFNIYATMFFRRLLFWVKIGSIFKMA
ncbi:hypothetical protein KKA09_01750 [Patescibacteria group bacterium]|nr:hypothetical protein [Patescibacteria group bacterium]